MAYMGLEVDKPNKPPKRKSRYFFLKTSADQVITNEENDTRLPAVLAEMVKKTATAQSTADAAIPKGAVTAIVLVDALPDEPDPTTLYLIP